MLPTNFLLSAMLLAVANAAPVQPLKDASLLESGQSPEPYRMDDATRHLEAAAATVSERDLNERNMPWKWIIPSMLGGAVTDHFLFAHPSSSPPSDLKDTPLPAPDNPEASKPGPTGDKSGPALRSFEERDSVAGERWLTTRDVLPAGFDINTLRQLQTRALGAQEISERDLSQRGLPWKLPIPSLDVRGPITTATEDIARVSGPAVAASKGIPWKAVLGSAVGGGVIDHLFFRNAPLPSDIAPARRSFPVAIREVDIADETDNAIAKRGPPIKWIIGGGLGGVVLDHIFFN
ncbi:hypothetical protein OC844_002426 [Tilletia horrida]|nr:hypothetical protein OC844_002426 [Tilletia horrida]